MSGFDIDHVAHLARLALTDDERAALAPQLQGILDYVARLQSLDTSGIEATFQILPRANVLRDDVAGAGLPTDQALANAPQREGSFFRMPRILELGSDGERSRGVDA